MAPPVQDSARDRVNSFSFSRSTTDSSSVLSASRANTFLPNRFWSSFTTGLISFLQDFSSSPLAVIRRWTSPVFAYGASVGFVWVSIISWISAATWLSPIPQIFTTWEQMISGCFLRRYEKTDSSNIGISSLGGPGRRMAVLPFFSRIRPGAVPLWLSSTIAPSGTCACL